MIRCIIIDDDSLSREVLRRMIEKDQEVTVVQEFGNGMDAAAFLKRSKDIDLVFLDIEMPEMTGMEFAEIMKEELPPTIFTTSHESFAVKAFHYNVCGYLLKPLQSAELMKAMQKAKALLKKKHKSASFLVKQGSSLVKIDPQNVTMIECIGDYVNLYCGQKKYTVHATMKSMEEKFPEPEYIRVHRSYIVKMNCIEEVEDDAILCQNKQIPIGKTYRTEFYSRFSSM